ncbi:hypothetical protein GYMLUDRAFT_703713 [Collybiopsis luxurians FD-317 M1]|uniref:Uncharacterized protein n=1 Tax=Collybiopsis luxurians FD-317 M1 TaxID=944289 RepID=A0A0D0B412_9AGAR|nr:hypothetical protein GYMLUDRAFT_703713 [Collybiopsis luxurians FD-317 M1]
MCLQLLLPMVVSYPLATALYKANLVAKLIEYAHALIDWRTEYLPLFPVDIGPQLEMVIWSINLALFASTQYTAQQTVVALSFFV